ncbi:branched-chain amino acid ABC transporter permease [Xenophilus sp. Marseille-Q4582]|uniref:branched-chain amino acid ABC transporter permease n=1 Tax=Xenophilus sp. Marseille-Q4582 TaxID=2866600 RepID=UPI001CE3E5F8|nr:branched-chain amino acid ABC transporter permease [Xenophilus sp. Marseille-Q4582]
MKSPAICVAGLLVGLLAVSAPLWTSDYHLSLGIALASWGTLASAWALFSGPTRYVSLATSAFFGVGAYATAVLHEAMPWPLVLAAAGAISLLLALVVGLSTLRLSGIYFVAFTFGLSELLRQCVTWFEVNYTQTLSRYVFSDLSAAAIYWQLLALCALVIGARALLMRSRWGLALRAVGDDELAAAHCGVPLTRVKLLAFVFSATCIGCTGALMATRWTYIDPGIAFNPNVSFQVLAMALFGGAARLLGPLLGVVPLALLFELLMATAPNAFSLLLGLLFMLIVYALPQGIAGWIGTWRLRLARRVPPDRSAA